MWSAGAILGELFFGATLFTTTGDSPNEQLFSILKQCGVPSVPTVEEDNPFEYSQQDVAYFNDLKFCKSVSRTWAFGRQGEGCLGNKRELC